MNERLTSDEVLDLLQLGHVFPLSDEAAGMIKSLEQGWNPWPQIPAGEGLLLVCTTSGKGGYGRCMSVKDKEGTHWSRWGVVAWLKLPDPPSWAGGASIQRGSDRA